MNGKAGRILLWVLLVVCVLVLGGLGAWAVRGQDAWKQGEKAGIDVIWKGSGTNEPAPQPAPPAPTPDVVGAEPTMPVPAEGEIKRVDPAQNTAAAEPTQDPMLSGSGSMTQTNGYTDAAQTTDAPATAGTEGQAVAGTADTNPAETPDPLQQIPETKGDGNKEKENTPEPTGTPAPTNTPEMTSTPEPTATPEPTGTPEPTIEPTPEPTPTPTEEPEEEIALTLSDNVEYENGKTTISWRKSTDKSVNCTVFVEMVDNGDVKQCRVNLGNTRNTSIETDVMIPDHRYKVTLCDARLNVLDEKVYDMPEHVVFQDGNLKNTGVRIDIGEMRKYTILSDYQKIYKLSAAEIISGFSDGTVYGVKFSMRMPVLARQRNFFVTVAFESPNGFVWVEVATNVTFDSVSGKYQTLWWELLGGEFFSKLYETTGEIPEGKYKTHLYWDGMWVNTSTFNVQK